MKKFAVVALFFTISNLESFEDQTPLDPAEYSVETFFVDENTYQKLTAAEPNSEIDSSSQEGKKTDSATEEKPNSEIKESKPQDTQKKHEKVKRPMNCENCAKSDVDLLNSTIKDLQTQIDNLNDKIADLETDQQTTGDELERLAHQPSEELLAKTNFLMVGTAYTFFTYLNRHNSTFGTVIDPVFLWRYGDNFLFEMKLDFNLTTDCETILSVVYATADYVINDYVIFRAGKFSLPLGLVWEKMTTGWINKLPNLPIPYVPSSLELIPPSDIGIDIRGAFPIGHPFGIGCEANIPFVIDYDLWVGNGPNQLDKSIRFGCNAEDNNYNKAIGARVGLRPQPFREIGFSGMRAQWNNNCRAGMVTSKRHLYFNAFVIDLNWGLTENSKLMGEYIWTERDIVCGNFYQRGWWLQYSSFLAFLDHSSCTFWKNTEFVTRAGGVRSDNKRWTRSQLSFGLNHYILNTLIVKGSYDYNTGKKNKENRVTFQVASAF